MKTIHIKVTDETIPVHQINHLDRIDPKHAEEVTRSGRYLVALDGKSVVGILKRSYFQAHIPYCENIQVYPSHQGQGIGKKLINHRHTLMRTTGYTLGFLSIHLIGLLIGIRNCDIRKSEPSTGERYCNGKMMWKGFWGKYFREIK